MGGLLTLPTFQEQFPSISPEMLATSDPERSARASRQGIAVAAYNLGCFGGAIMTIFIGDIFGRRRIIFVGSIIMVIGAALQCSSFGLAQFVVGRVITGWGNGMNTSTVGLIALWLSYNR